MVKIIRKEYPNPKNKKQTLYDVTFVELPGMVETHGLGHTRKQVEKYAPEALRSWETTQREQQQKYEKN